MTTIILGPPSRRPPVSLEPTWQCPTPVPRDILGQAIALAGEMVERHADRLKACL
jgi:hypothetical protein